MSKPTRQLPRNQAITKALQVEVVSLLWVGVEATVGPVLAAMTNSLAMSAFSFDSGVEFISGLVVLSRIWREFQVGHGEEVRRLERFSSAVVAACLFALAAFISFKSGQALAARSLPAPSTSAILLALASCVITPYLAKRKHRLGCLLHSHALLGDAACGFTCAYMAFTLLFGLLTERWFGWWWMDPVAAVGILYFVIEEAMDSAKAAFSGEAHQH